MKNGSLGHMPKREINHQWRREGDSNPIYTAFGFRVTDRDSHSQVVTFAFVFKVFLSFQLSCFSDRL
jgi:hypothetical protein